YFFRRRGLPLMRVVFMGTPEFAVPTLTAILAAGHAVAAVYTQPPRPAGRGLAGGKVPHPRPAQRRRPAPVPPPTPTAGPPATPPTPRSDAEARPFTGHRAASAVVVAYGLILPSPVLQAPREGCLNLHASALPRWRGAAPIARAIIAGDAETAATVMRMEAGLD